MQRRELLFGGACAVAAGAAYALKPRRDVSLLVGSTLAVVVPSAFGDWTSREVGDPLAINGPGTLSAKLYNELVVRVYTNTVTGSEVMMLLAYGAKQTDELQLHRPEVCYPAFGYALVRNEPVGLQVAPGVSIPARQLVAEVEDRRESVMYWSRMGEFLPSSAGEQREMRLKIAMQGIIPDGLLARFSVVTLDEGSPFSELGVFIPALLRAVAHNRRQVLIGTERAQAMSRN